MLRGPGGFGPDEDEVGSSGTVIFDEDMERWPLGRRYCRRMDVRLFWPIMRPLCEEGGPFH
jgi:hypothetical protein